MKLYFVETSFYGQKSDFMAETFEKIIFKVICRMLNWNNALKLCIKNTHSTNDWVFKCIKLHYLVFKNISFYKIVYIYFLSV